MEVIRILLLLCERPETAASPYFLNFMEMKQDRKVPKKFQQWRSCPRILLLNLEYKAFKDCHFQLWKLQG